MEQRTCKKCGCTGPLDKTFHKTHDRKGNLKYRHTCKNCYNAMSYQWKQDHRERCLDNRREHHMNAYGLPDAVMTRFTHLCTVYSFAQMESEHKGVCAICGRKVDHNHNCCGEGKACDECRRGLLCTDCNTALGKFQDSPVILHNAIEYLNKSSILLGSTKV